MTLYGVAEIAERIGVRRETVSVWLGRGRLPEPTARLACGPVWTAERIGPWIRTMRRRYGEARIADTTNGREAR